jgi:uncharacterized membrane protein YgdD (TMEM256/DUF423 family)
MHAVTSLRTGAILAGLAVGLGAFAAHAMKAHYEPQALQTFETGVRYQMYHALALLGCGLLAARGHRTGAAAWSFVLGILLFSGSLFAMTWTGQRWLGAVTPFGGVAFLVGWLLLAVAAGRGGTRPEPGA